MRQLPLTTVLGASIEMTLSLEAHLLRTKGVLYKGEFIKNIMAVVDNIELNWTRPSPNTSIYRVPVYSLTLCAWPWYVSLIEFDGT